MLFVDQQLKSSSSRHFLPAIPILTVTLQIRFFMGVFKQLAEYLYLRKPDPNRPKTQFVKYMHGINRLSLLLFLIALIILIIRLTLKR